jgi:hypothetical protein
LTAIAYFNPDFSMIERDLKMHLKTAQDSNYQSVELLNPSWSLDQNIIAIFVLKTL